MLDSPMAAIEWLGSPSTVASFQRACGVHTFQADASKVQHVVRFPVLYWLFKFGSFLGQEEFYGLFFPFMFWNFDRSCARRMIFVWAFTLFLGECLKDILKRPRPCSPPAVYLEKMYLSEYGFPSTHAMVGVSIPFAYTLFCAERYNFSMALGLTVVLSWSLIVSLSRVYMGMHSFLDVICGTLLALFLLALLYPLANYLDRIFVTNILVPITLTLLCMVSCVLYPTGDFSPQLADATATLSLFSGAYVGSYFYYQCVARQQTPLFQQAIFVPIGIWLIFSRFLIGMGVAAATEYALQMLKLRTKPADPTGHRVFMVLQCFAIYFVLSVSACFLAPMIFYLLGFDLDAPGNY